MNRIEMSRGTTVLRLSLGAMFLTHGLVLKLMTYGFAGTAGYFASIGLPEFLAYLVVVAEIVGGALLILNVVPGFVAAALLPVLLGATWAHAGNGWVFSGANGGWEYPVFWTVTLFVQALLGDGAYALRRGHAARPALQTA